MGCKDDNTCILKLADAAAIDFGYFYNDNSIREDREYFSNIFRVRNAQGKIGYTYNVASIGKPHEILSSSSIGFELEATIHTHGAYDVNYIGNNFSGVSMKRGDRYIPFDDLRKSNKQDLKNANANKMNIYLVTPNGSLLKYIYNKGKIITLSTDMPSDKNDPTALNYRYSSIETHPINMEKLLYYFKKMLRLNPKTYE